MEHLRYLERAPLWNLYWWWRYYRAIGWRESGPRKLRYLRRLITAEKRLLAPGVPKAQVLAVCACLRRRDCGCGYAGECPLARAFQDPRYDAHCPTQADKGLT